MKDASSYLHPIGMISAAERLYEYSTLKATNWQARCLMDALTIQRDIYLNTCKAMGRLPYTEPEGVHNGQRTKED